MKKYIYAAAIFLLSFLLIGMQIAYAQEDFPVIDGEEPQIPPAEPQMPGRLEGNGTHFEINNSEYLNITLDSSEPVHLILESIPEMVEMHIEAVSPATSTVITLSGFLPSTTYYKYEDNYHNLVTFTTDDNGNYTYTQDISTSHLVFIQPRASTKYIPTDTTIGTWDSVNRIYTLTTDVSETIQINEDNLTLDGAGHTITGSNFGYGVYLYQRTDVTIKNLNVQKFSYGIYLYRSSSNTLTGNTASNNHYRGIFLSSSSSNTLTGNTASNNRDWGIFLSSSSSNTLTSNTASNNRYSGISLWDSNSNTLTSNTASYNPYCGISLSSSSSNTLTGNTASDNNLIGISLSSSSSNTLTDNTMLGNHYNFIHWGSLDSHFTNNIDTSNTVDGKPIYYVKNAVDQVYDSSTNAGTFYLINCNNITIKDLMLTKNGAGVFLWRTQNSRIENVNAQSNYHYGIFLGDSNSNTLTSNTVSDNNLGIYLYRSSSNTLTGNTASNNHYRGIFLSSSSSNTLTGNTASNNRDWGIFLSSSSSNTLTSNTASNNRYSGISLWDSNSNTLTSNTASYNPYCGISLSSSSSNTLTGNTASDNNLIGISLSSSSSNTLTDNTMLGNHYNFIHWGSLDSHFTNNIDTSNTVDGKPIYYVKNAVDQVYDSSTNAGTFYLINCNNITIKDLMLTKNGAGVFLWRTQNSRIENVNAQSNYYNGICLYDSSSNTLTGNTASDNNRHGICLYDSSSNTLTGNTASTSWSGIYLFRSSDNTLTGNTASNNRDKGIYLFRSSDNTLTGNTASNNDDGISLYDSSSNTLTGNTASNNDDGISLYYSSYNQIYNNNFIDNPTQAYVFLSKGNDFNLDKPVGGNYWSDWTTPDNDGDGFVDNPYVFSGDQDNLPWVRQDGWRRMPPVANASGPYVGDEGSLITFDASGSYDPDGSIVLYEWDFDGDEIYDNSSTSPTATFTWGDDYIGTVTLRVTDNDGLSDTDTADITVNNVAPTVSIDSVEQPRPQFILPYQNLTFNGSFTDPGWLDMHTSHWGFGDGSSDPGTLTEENDEPDATGTTAAIYNYSAPGMYSVILTITDDDGGVGIETDTITVTIASPTDAIDLINDYIQNLPDDAFANNPDQRKNAFSNKFDQVKTKIEAGDYEGAINKLQKDILSKLDCVAEEDTADLDWISDVAAQQEAYTMIEDVVAYLETLL